MTLHYFEHKAIPVSLKSATLNLYQMCVSDGSCLCEACMFMKHIICVSLQYVYMQLPVAITAYNIFFLSLLVNIGRIYALELYNVHKGGLKYHQLCLFLKAIPLT